MSRKRDTVTLDLFDWEPPEVVVSYQDEPAVDRVDSIEQTRREAKRGVRS